MSDIAAPAAESQEEAASETITPSAGMVGSLAGQRLLLLLVSREHPIGQIVRFGMLAGMSAVVTIGLPVLLHEIFGVSPQRAAAIAFVTAFFLNFVSLRRLVFRSEHGAGRDLVTFAVSSLVFRAGEYLLFLLLTLVLHVQYVVALVVVLSLSTVLKFVWYRKVMHVGRATN